MSNMIYLDYNSTTPLHPELLTFVTENLSKFGNASSVHGVGREAKKLIALARSNISKFLNIDPLEIVFTSGGSEGNTMAFKGIAKYFSPERCEIICSPVEHPSVIKAAESLQEKGFKIHWLKILKTGDLDFKHYTSLLCERTAFVSVQIVNNETGNIFPVKEISRLAHKFGALMHSDMVQGLGKISIDLKDLDVDLATFAGHKFYSLKGCGFLYIKRGTKIEPLILGGGQERTRRAGTENALAIATLGQAVKILGPRLLESNERLRILRDGLESNIKSAVRDCKVNGVESPRVANTSNMGFDNIDGETLLINLDTRGFAVSSGAACSSGSQEPSPVLRAMGLTSEQASQSLRISLGWLTTDDEVQEFFKNLVSSVNQMRETRNSIKFEEESERELVI